MNEVSCDRIVDILISSLDVVKNLVNPGGVVLISGCKQSDLLPSLLPRLQKAVLVTGSILISHFPSGSLK